MNINNHGVLRSNSLDQDRNLTEKVWKTLTENKSEPNYAPANDGGTTGLVERLSQTIKRQLSVWKNVTNNMQYMQHDLIWRTFW